MREDQEERDPRAVKREKAGKREQDQIDADLAQVLSTPAGRRYVYRISGEKDRDITTPMTGNSWTYYNNGMETHGRMVIREVKTKFPELYLEMIKEALSAKKESTDE